MNYRDVNEYLNYTMPSGPFPVIPAFAGVTEWMKVYFHRKYETSTEPNAQTMMFGDGWPEETAIRGCDAR